MNVAGNVATEDHNCLFTTGSTLSSVAGNTYATAAAHQAGTGQGTGDTDVDPVFPVQPDLHLANCVSDLNGEYFFVVASDLDGDARGNPVCDMGADEYNGVGVIAAPAITVLVDDLPYALGLNATFSNYNWSTGATTPTTLITSGGTVHLRCARCQWLPVHCEHYGEHRLQHGCIRNPGERGIAVSNSGHGGVDRHRASGRGAL
ncbi:MAG: hypothetical protein IPO17_00985 [Flavobacteriales bacterium]|nr:hypothetical protein [Flavobacteriales bacterium]